MFKNAVILLLAASASAQNLRGEAPEDRELWTAPVVPTIPTAPIVPFATLQAVQANGQANADTFGGPALATSQALANNLGAGTSFGNSAAYANNFGPIGSATASSVGQANVFGGIAQGTGTAAATNFGYGGIAQAAGTGIANNFGGGLASSLGSASALNFNGGNAIATGAAQSVNLGLGGATATSSAVATSGQIAALPALPGGVPAGPAGVPAGPAAPVCNGAPPKPTKCNIVRKVPGVLQYHTKGLKKGLKIETRTPGGKKVDYTVPADDATQVKNVDLKPHQPYEKYFELQFTNACGQSSGWTRCVYC